jgi:prepilin-type processing-associated H-X9-DG protein
MRFCPTASTPANDVKGGHQDLKGVLVTVLGGTFRAWGPYFPTQYLSHYGSYGVNPWHFEDQIGRAAPDAGPWYTTDVRGADRVPVMLDSATLMTGAADNGDNGNVPPQRDAIPVTPADSSQQSCMNRHNGGVNGMFLDWSVRKVGLKELWTLTWYPEYNTAGPWTKAGGVRRDDWPEWLRKFRDY